MQPKVIFEDSEILVLDKPAGMIVNRSDTTKREKTVQDWVEDYLKIRSTKHEIRNKSKIPNDQNSFGFRNSDFEFARRAGIVHRLDKETSGILLVAKTLQAFVNLQAQFKERKVQKTYLALAHGKIEPQEGEINVAVGRLPWNRKRFGVLSGGRGSITMYKVLSIMYYVSGENKEPLSLVELSPKTGRTHQIRVHLQYIKHPIFADPLYAGRKTARNDRKMLPRIFLHAAKISFFHPASAKTSSFDKSSADRSAGKPAANELISFASPLPDDLNNFLERLKA